jgi:hypothetical protein
MRKTKRLKLTPETVRHLATHHLREARGGSPDASYNGECQPGSVPPYVCATDVGCNKTVGPCDQSDFGPCG